MFHSLSDQLVWIHSKQFHYDNSIITKKVSSIVLIWTVKTFWSIGSLLLCILSLHFRIVLTDQNSYPVIIRFQKSSCLAKRSTQWPIWILLSFSSLVTCFSASFAYTFTCHDFFNVSVKSVSVSKFTCCAILLTTSWQFFTQFDKLLEYFYQFCL